MPAPTTAKPTRQTLPRTLVLGKMRLMMAAKTAAANIRFQLPKRDWRQDIRIRLLGLLRGRGPVSELCPQREELAGQVCMQIATMNRKLDEPHGA